MPELSSVVASFDEWIARAPDLPPAAGAPASTQAMGTMSPIGYHLVKLRGVEIKLAFQHYSLWMLGRVLDHYDSLCPKARGRADEILEATSLAPMLQARPARRIERIGFAEVLGD